MNKLLLFIFFLSGLELQYSIRASGENLQTTGRIKVLYQTTCPAKFENKDTILTDTMELYTGGIMSLYQVWNRNDKDIRLKQMRSQIKVSGDKTVVFYDEVQLKRFTPNDNLPKIWNETWTTEQIFRNDSQFVYIDKLDERRLMKTERTIAVPKWSVTSDTLIVAGYHCCKATTTFLGRSFIVWFTEDIPVQDGPWLLSGLPGLIMKAEDATAAFKFTAIGLETLKQPEIIRIPTEDVKTVSYKEYRTYQMKNNKISYCGRGIGVWKGYICYFDAPNPLRRIPIEQ